MIGVLQIVVTSSILALIAILYCRETTTIWISIDVPPGQPPGQYEGDVFLTAIKADAE